MASRGALVEVQKSVQSEFIQMKSQMGDYKGWLELVYDATATSIKLGQTGDQSDDPFAAIGPIIPEKNHRFYIFKSPLHSEKGKFLLAHWGPDATKVKERMHYASARQPVKDMLGSSDFTDDHFASTKKEFDLEYYRHVKEVLPSIDVRSGEEIMKEEVENDTQPVGTQTAVLKQLAVKYDEGMEELFDKFKQMNCDTIIMNLDAKDQKLQGNEGHEDFLELVESLAESGPCFILHRYKHNDKEGSSTALNIFIYYSPTNNKDRRAKFTYSLCKANATQLIESFEIKIGDKFEYGDSEDITDDSILKVLYPEEMKHIISEKPKAPGANKKSRSKKKKKAAALEGL